MLNITVTLESSGLDAITAGLAQSQGSSPPAPIRDMYTKWASRTQAFNEERFDRFSVGGGDWAPLALSTIRRRQEAEKRGKAGSLTRFNQQYGGQRHREHESKGARSSLARDTKRGGALVSANRTVSILKDSGIMRGALKIGAPGSTFEMIPAGMVYGVAGSTPHPPKPKKKAATPVTALELTLRSGKPVGRKTPKVKSSGVRSMPTIGQIAGFHQVGGGRLPKREIIVVPDQTVIDFMAHDAVEAVLKLAT